LTIEALTTINLLNLHLITA